MALGLVGRGRGRKEGCGGRLIVLSLCLIPTNLRRDLVALHHFSQRVLRTNIYTAAAGSRVSSRANSATLSKENSVKMALSTSIVNGTTDSHDRGVPKYCKAGVVTTEGLDFEVAVEMVLVPEPGKLLLTRLYVMLY